MDGGKVICPAWVRQKLNELAGELDGSHAEVLVAAAAVLGTDGYDVQALEEATRIDPEFYGPVMLEGYSMLAAAALEAIFTSVHQAAQGQQHFTQEIEDDNERMQELRNLYEQAFRGWLQSVIAYAGEQFQAKAEQHDLSIAAGSQMLNLWLEVARRPIRFPTQEQPPDERSEPAAGQ